jgi:5-bromo-4-chloroindolyl phosphate hydrolysis protein
MRRLIELDRLIVSQEMEPPVQKLIAVSRDIFELISKDKRKLRQTRQFMNYYLPTALKLLTDYADFEQQEVKGENALESMRKIEGVMDTLVTAFQRELDALYLDKAIDISADIEVMKAMIQTDAGGKNHG